MKFRITKHTTYTIETIPVQKSKCPTGGRPTKQSIYQRAKKIINRIK